MIEGWRAVDPAPYRCVRPIQRQQVMRAFHRLALSVAIAMVACSPRQGNPGEAVASRSTDLITIDEIGKKQWSNAYELVSTLRPNWLAYRGPDSFGAPGELKVRIDGVRVGGIEMLRSTPVMGVSYIQYINPIDAAARWGLGYNHGAILISTLPQRH
jgi:hypothetical protein